MYNGNDLGTFIKLLPFREHSLVANQHMGCMKQRTTDPAFADKQQSSVFRKSCVPNMLTWSL